MAKFCFLSFLSPGHMDFGGNGFALMAKALLDMNHQVMWVFSYSERHNYLPWAERYLEHLGVPCDPASRFHLTKDHHASNLRKSATDLKAYLKLNAFDCLVIDRICVGASLAASSAGIPWAVVGTDGRHWSFRKWNGRRAILLPSQGRSTGQSIDDDLLGSKDYWAMSPYLNISFFPRAYYQDSDKSTLPAHSHFLGSGTDISDRQHRDAVLLTFGNTFSKLFRTEVLESFVEPMKKRQIPILVLTGRKELAEELRRRFPQKDSVRIESWMPYAEAFSRARIAIGHGGTSHVWTGLDNGIPLLAFPSIGDQFFGGMQLERLGAGKAIYIDQPSPFLARVPRLTRRIFGKDGLVPKGTFINTLQQLLDDVETKRVCSVLQKQMASGGGPVAGARLLETLARERKAITSCSGSQCCC